MSAAKETLAMFLIWENERSIFVTGDQTGRRKLHLPRSLIDRLTKYPKPAGPLCYQPIEFTLPEWKINQENLWEFVK